MGSERARCIYCGEFLGHDENCPLERVAGHVSSTGEPIGYVNDDGSIRIDARAFKIEYEAQPGVAYRVALSTKAAEAIEALIIAGDIMASIVKQDESVSETAARWESARKRIIAALEGADRER